MNNVFSTGRSGETGAFGYEAVPRALAHARARASWKMSRWHLSNSGVVVADVLRPETSRPLSSWLVGLVTR